MSDHTIVEIKDKQRDFYYDFLRGIAIMMVIGIHTYTDGFMHFNLFLRQFLNCAVPIFLAISGYFIGRKNFENGSYGIFLQKQIPRVYIPMLIWSIPWLLLSLHQGELLSKSLVRVFVGDMSISIFYFIILIMQYYILTPFIQRANTQFGGGKYAVMITLIGITLFDYLLRIKSINVPLVGSAGLFPVWLIFYVMGVLKAQKINLPFLCKRPLTWAIFAILLCCLQIGIMYKLNGGVVHGIKLSAHIYSFFVVMWLFTKQARSCYSKIQNTKVVHHVIVVGKLSFFIYLTHCLFLYALNYIQFPNAWSLRWVTCLCLSYGMAMVFDKVCPQKMKKYFGF